jgi:hypothetical protein
MSDSPIVLLQSIGAVSGILDTRTRLCRDHTPRFHDGHIAITAAVTLIADLSVQITTRLGPEL